MNIYNIIFFHKGKGSILAADMPEAIAKTKQLIMGLFGSDETQVHVDTSGPWPVFSETMSYPDAPNPCALLVYPAKGDDAVRFDIVETCAKQNSEGYVALMPKELMPIVDGLREVEIIRIRDGRLEVSDREGRWSARA